MVHCSKDLLFTITANISAPINPGSIPSVINLVSAHANRTSVGGGISPLNFAQTQSQVRTFVVNPVFM